MTVRYHPGSESKGLHWVFIVCNSLNLSMFSIGEKVLILKHRFVYWRAANYGRRKYCGTRRAPSERGSHVIKQIDSVFIFTISAYYCKNTIDKSGTQAPQTLQLSCQMAPATCEATWQFNEDDELANETYDNNGNTLSSGGQWLFATYFPSDKLLFTARRRRPLRAPSLE